MRKLLQNKLIVSILAAVAVLSIVGNFVKLPSFRTLKASAREAVPLPTPQLFETGYHIHGPAFFQLSRQPWRDLFPIDSQARDPFALPASNPAAAIPLIESQDPALPPRFTLQGVSIAASRTLAVINQSILAEGEFIAGYRVDRILPHSVHLSGPIGPLVVELNQPPAANKSATAKAGNADLPAESKQTESGFKKQ